jgi:hypothetical protein
VGRYVSEAWFGRRLAHHPPAYRRAPDGSPRSLPATPGQPEPPGPARPGLTQPAGMALIIGGIVLLLAVSIPLSFLNVKLLGLILIVAGLVKVRALQRASGWLWRNRREVMTALDAPLDETAAPRVPLDTLLNTTGAPSRRARRRARRQAKRQAAGPERRRGPARRLGPLGRRRGHRRVPADQLARAGDGTSRMTAGQGGR